MKNLEHGAIVQGGSTITQQVAKSFYLSSERTMGRKIREIVLAYRINKNLKKYEILNLYLNQIYLGHGDIRDRGRFAVLFREKRRGPEPA